MRERKKREKEGEMEKRKEGNGLKRDSIDLAFIEQQMHEVVG